MFTEVTWHSNGMGAALAIPVTPNLHHLDAQASPNSTHGLDQGGSTSPLNANSCGKLGHTAKFCRRRAKSWSVISYPMSKRR